MISFPQCEEDLKILETYNKTGPEYDIYLTIRLLADRSYVYVYIYTISYYIILYYIILYYIISYQIQVVEHNSQSFRCPESTVVMCEGLQIHVMPSNLFAEAFGQAQMKTMRAKIGFTSIYFVEINHQ